MYFLECEPEAECFDCMQKENHLDDIKYWFTAVLDQLFGIDEFNGEELMRYLNEITISLKMKFPERPLSVVRQNRTIDITKLLDEWKKDTINYSKKLAIGS